MTRVTITEDLTVKLPSLGEFFEICDRSGRVVGRFSPEKPDPKIYEGLEPQISEEEIRRRMRDRSGRTLDEILKDLDKTA